MNQCPPNKFGEGGEDLKRFRKNITLIRTAWMVISITSAGMIWADSAGQRETLALQSCLVNHPDAEHLCFDVPYYTCMGEQLVVAANPELATERCLFQELFVWGDLIEKACDDLSLLFEEGTAEWDAVCFNNNSTNWGYLTQNIEKPDWDHGFSNLSLRLSTESTRSFAVQLRTFCRGLQE